MKTFNEGGGIGLAAMKAGMDRKTARRYLRIGTGPTAPKLKRHWQTHPDAFATICLAAARASRDPPPFFGDMPSRIPFAAADEQRVLAALQQFRPRDRCAIVLGLNTGYRAAELAAITWGDVWDSGSDQIRSEVTVSRRHLKGGHGVRRAAVRSRTVPLNPSARGAIADYRRQLRDRGPIDPAAPLLQSTRGGAGLRRWQLNALVQRAVAVAGLPPTRRYGTHSLRKSFCRKVYEATGRDINLTRVAMGHRNITTTQAYLEADLPKLRSVILGLG